MEIYGNFKQKVNVDPIDVIEELKHQFLGDHLRWVCKNDDKWVIEGRCYHNSAEVIREITDSEKEYFDALKVVRKYLHEK